MTIHNNKRVTKHTHEREKQGTYTRTHTHHSFFLLSRYFSMIFKSFWKSPKSNQIESNLELRARSLFLFETVTNQPVNLLANCFISSFALWFAFFKAFGWFNNGNGFGISVYCYAKQFICANANFNFNLNALIRGVRSVFLNSIEFRIGSNVQLEDSCFRSKFIVCRFTHNQHSTRASGLYRW